MEAKASGPSACEVLPEAQSGQIRRVKGPSPKGDSQISMTMDIYVHELDAHALDADEIAAIEAMDPILSAGAL